MSSRNDSLFASTALAIFVTTITSASSAFAADIAAKALPAAPLSSFFSVVDNSVSFTWYPSATDPGVAGSSNLVNAGIQNTPNTFSKYVGSLTHFDVWAYGTNFINVDYIRSNSRDPIRGIAGAEGATEFYGFARSTISGNAVSGTKMFSNWFFKDISFEFGGDLNTNNTPLSPEIQKLVVGAQFAFNLPGTVNLGVLAVKEWNHNQFLTVFGPGTIVTPAEPVGGSVVVTGDRDFNWAPRLELTISEPLTFLPLPLTWNSTTGVTFPKGTGISQANMVALGDTMWQTLKDETKTEVLADNRLTLDLSKLWWGKERVWDGYVGYRFWYNKFGTDHNNALFASVGCFQPGSPGLAVKGIGTCAPDSSVESTVYIGTTYHFK